MYKDLASLKFKTEHAHYGNKECIFNNSKGSGY